MCFVNGGRSILLQVRTIPIIDRSRAGSVHMSIRLPIVGLATICVLRAIIVRERTMLEPHMRTIKVKEYMRTMIHCLSAKYIWSAKEQYGNRESWPMKNSGSNWLTIHLQSTQLCHTFSRSKSGAHSSHFKLLTHQRFFRPIFVPDVCRQQSLPRHQEKYLFRWGISNEGARFLAEALLSLLPLLALSALTDYQP